MIHPTAIIDEGARLGPGVTVGPYAVIGPEVEIGADCWIGPHAVIRGPSRIGAGNWIYQFASIGEAPQDKKYQGESTRLEVGQGNVIREFVTVSRGTASGGGVTRIGDHNWIMAYVHVAHDCQVGDHVTFANNASLAGHVSVSNHVTFGGFVLVHQFCAVGAHAFCGMGCAINQDVPPYVMASGNPGRPHGINRVGLKRHGYSQATITALQRVYRLLYRSGLRLAEATDRIEAEYGDMPEVRLLLEFIRDSERGILR